MFYKLVVEGVLTERFAEAFPGMMIKAEGGQSIIMGHIVDQAHLYGIIDRISSLGLQLVSVQALPGYARGEDGAALDYPRKDDRIPAAERPGFLREESSREPETTEVKTMTENGGDGKIKEIGPVQLLAIGFGPGAKFEGRIMDELSNLERKETIRILDLLFVHKDAETSDLLALDYQGEDLGAIVGALLGFEFEGDEQPVGSMEERVESHAFGLSQRDIEALAASLDPGSSAGFLLVEHVWARDLKRAIRQTGGFPLGEGFLTPEAVAEVAAELAALVEIYDELEAEEAGTGA
jgi:uncharacterized membrane protein